MRPLRCAVALIALGMTVLAFAPATAGAAAPCHGRSAAGDVRQFQRSLLCLHNAERRKHGLSRMHWNGTLARVGGAYARDMVARHYFGHFGPGGRDHMDRLASTGYKPGVGCWTAGENLLTSNGPSTASQVMQAWMNSPAHRQNVLRAGWHDFGLGVARAAPRGGPRGLTLVALFGVRSKRLCG